MMDFHKRILSCFTLFAALLWFGACTADSAKTTDDVVAPVKAEPEAASIDCATPPEPVLCCQAMIPACDQCREESRLAVESWQKKCGSKSADGGEPDIRNGVDCRANPSLAQCCTTAEPSCDSCRKRVARLLEMQKKHCN